MLYDPSDDPERKTLVDETQLPDDQKLDRIDEEAQTLFKFMLASALAARAEAPLSSEIPYNPDNISFNLPE